MKYFLIIAVFLSLALHASLLWVFQDLKSPNAPSLGVKPGFFVFEVERASTLQGEPTPKLIIPKENIDSAPVPAKTGSSKLGETTPSKGGTSGGEGNRLVEGTLIPQYPPLSRRKGEEGSVTLRAEVFPSGEIGKVEMVKSSGYSRLDNAAVATLRAATFSTDPNTKENAFPTITIQFRLK